MRDLKTYLSETGETQAEFAGRIGVSQGTVSKLCKGLISPSLTLALKIDTATDGEVSVKAWAVGPSPQEGEAA